MNYEISSSNERIFFDKLQRNLRADIVENSGLVLRFITSQIHGRPRIEKLQRKVKDLFETRTKQSTFPTQKRHDEKTLSIRQGRRV